MASDALIARLKAALRASQPVTASQVHFINLDAVRERYGDHWPQARARVFDAMQGFLERRLEPEDLLMRAGDGFLVFPDPDRREAPDDFATRIEAELKAFFLGTMDLRDIEIGVAALKVSPEELLRTIERNADDDPGAALAPQGRGHNEPDAKPQGPAFELTFLPVWSAASSTLALFAATPLADYGSGRVLTRPASRDAVEALDRAVLARIARTLAAGGARPGAIAAPVGYSTLTDAARRVAYLGALRDLEQTHGRRLILRVVDTPADAPATVLNQALRMAGPSAAHLAVDVTTAGPNALARFSGGSADIFTLAAPADAEAMAGRLDAYRVAVRDAHRLRARVWITHCRSPEAARAALASGAQFLSGGAIAKPGPQPGPVRKVSLAPAQKAG